MKKLDRKQMAARVARDIPEGAYVNLGIGLPTLVGDYLPKGREIILHSENGILGVGPSPRRRDRRGSDQRRKGAGHPACGRRVFPPRRLLRHDPRPPPRLRHSRAFQVSASGDLANWHTGGADAIPAVGGAMDLAVGAKKCW
jgi:3-oxoadipate CoA-transferase beta subunit